MTPKQYDKAKLLELQKALLSMHGMDKSQEHAQGDVSSAFDHASLADDEYAFAFVQGAADDNENEDAIPLWLVSFTDIMALMLTFFVLLYSMSVPDEVKWEEMIITSEQGLINQQTLHKFSGTMQTFTVDKIDTKKALNLRYLERIVQERFSDYLENGQALLMATDDRLIISMPSDVVFDTAKSDLSLEGKQVLFGLAELLRLVPNRLEIVGHSDPRPLTSNDYDSNWDLSMMRALKVGQVLNQSGYKKEVSVRGASSSRYEMISDTLSEDVRQSLSRRVDVMIMPDTGKQRFFAPSLAR